MRKIKNYFLFAAALAIILLTASLYHPEKSSAIGLCSLVGDPSIKIDIAGQQYTADSTITVAAGTQLTFTVYTYAEPSSPNSINYPGGSYSYPGPSGYLGSGRTYTTIPINTTSSINVWLGQNCQADPNQAGEANLTITINIASSCQINSFTCTGTNPDLAWSTSNCTGITINNSVGSVPAVGSYSPAAFGTVYTMSTAEGVSAQANPCPTAPTAALDSVWQENNGKTITKTVTPGSSVTVPLNFSNTGQSGSTVSNTQCAKGFISGIDSNMIDKPTCDNTTLTAP